MTRQVRRAKTKYELPYPTYNGQPQHSVYSAVQRSQQRHNEQRTASRSQEQTHHDQNSHNKIRKALTICSATTSQVKIRKVIRTAYEETLKFSISIVWHQLATISLALASNHQPGTSQQPSAWHWLATISLALASNHQPHRLETATKSCNSRANCTVIGIDSNCSTIIKRDSIVIVHTCFLIKRTRLLQSSAEF